MVMRRVDNSNSHEELERGSRLDLTDIRVSDDASTGMEQSVGPHGMGQPRNHDCSRLRHCINSKPAVAVWLDEKRERLEDMLMFSGAKH